VHADNHDATNKAKQVLKDAGAEDIGSSPNEATTIMMVPNDTTSPRLFAQQ
jgi:hypothetical protein